MCEAGNDKKAEGPDRKKSEIIEAQNRMFMIFMKTHPEGKLVSQYLDEKDRVHELVTKM